jgi:hypothetical protein
MGVSGYIHSPSALLPKNWLHGTKLGGPQSRPGRGGDEQKQDVPCPALPGITSLSSTPQSTDILK